VNITERMRPLSAYNKQFFWTSYNWEPSTWRECPNPLLPHYCPTKVCTFQSVDVKDAAISNSAMTAGRNVWQKLHQAAGVQTLHGQSLEETELHQMGSYNGAGACTDTSKRRKQ
jgi:hypothetical protein